MAKVQNPAAPVPGKAYNYIYTITNHGPSDASGVALIDALAPSVIFIPSSSGPGDCNENGGIVRCDLGGLLSGDSVTVIIPVSVAPSVIGSMTNTVFAVANEADLDLSNNTVREIAAVNRSVDLALSKSYSPDLATEPNTIAYTFTVLNNGPSDAGGIILTDVLPEGVTFASFTGGALSCAAVENTVTCQLGTLAAGETKSLSMFFTHTARGTITTSARVSSEQEDPIPDNNEATATADVRFVPVEPPAPEVTNNLEQSSPLPVETAESA